LVSRSAGQVVTEDKLPEPSVRFGVTRWLRHRPRAVPPRPPAAASPGGCVTQVADQDRPDHLAGAAAGAAEVSAAVAKAAAQAGQTGSTAALPGHRGAVTVLQRAYTAIPAG